MHAKLGVHSQFSQTLITQTKDVFKIIWCAVTLGAAFLKQFFDTQVIQSITKETSLFKWNDATLKNPSCTAFRLFYFLNVPTWLCSLVLPCSSNTLTQDEEQLSANPALNVVGKCWESRALPFMLSFEQKDSCSLLHARCPSSTWRMWWSHSLMASCHSLQHAPHLACRGERD